MARSGSREDVQDRILNQMERASRGSNRGSHEKSLKEQLEEEAARVALSPEERLKAMTWGEYQDHIKAFISEKRVTVSSRCWNSAVTKNKGVFQEFHSSGTPASEVVEWLKDLDMKLLNN